MAFNLVQAQDIKIIKVNASQYPVIKATFLATSSKGEKVTDAKLGDFTTSENKVPCKILEVTNPKEIAVPASIVLVLDVSLSMTGERLLLAKKAARAFIEQVPLETSEVAIVSFSDEVYVNCDFTQNLDRLSDALETLHTVGGTSYTKAFLHEPTGALSMAGGGRNKRCIIFLTDGLSNTNGAEVIDRAMQKKTAVYCITLELPIPDVLREISNKTGGKHYEAIANIEQLDGIYSDIFQSLEVTKFGTVTWQAVKDCKKVKNAHLTFRGKSINLNYEIPKEKVGSFEIDPTLLAFGSALPGANKNLSFDIVARNIPINFTKISIAGKSPFHLSDSVTSPFILEPEHVKNITLTYSPKDTKMASDKLTVSTRECPDKTVSLLGGSDEQLRLICPKGGEKLVVGMDTSVRWEGVKRDKNISITYRTKPDMPWKPIGEGKNLLFSWLTPNDTGRQVQVKLSPLIDQSGELYLMSTMPNQKSGIRSAYFSNDGNKVVSIDRNSIIRIWDTQSGKLLSTFEGFRSSNASFCNNDKSILSFSKDEILVWSSQSTKLIDRQTINNKIVFTSFILPDGTEKQLTCTILKDMANTYKIFMPGLNKTAFLFEKDFINSGSLTLDGTKALTLSSDNVLKIWDIPKAKSIVSSYQPSSPISIIINPNGKTALIIGPGTLTMIDLKSGKELFHNQRFTYRRFSPSGDMIITTAYDNSTTFIDSYTGKFLTTIGNIGFYKALSTGYNLVYFKNDSITIADIAHRKRLFQVYKPGTVDVAISPDNTKLMAIMQSNVIDLFDIAKGTKTHRIGDIDSDIRTALFSKDGTSIIVVMANNSMQYWSPQGINQTKEVTSGYFSIIAPKPKVKKSIRFDDQFINQSKELMVTDFITNPTPYPLVISTIEIINEDKSSFELVSHPFPIHLKPLAKEAGEFRFTPKRKGLHKTWIRTCTPTDTFLTEVVGNGIDRRFEIASNNITFGKLAILEHRDTLSTIIKNRGTVPIVINQVINYGPDAVQFSYLTPKKTFTVAPGDSLRIKVRFAPKYRGKTSGSLQLKIQGFSDPQYINLTGEGLASREVWIVGKTLNSSDSMPLKATVNCYDLASCNTIKSAESGVNGKFAIKFNADRNYGITAEKPGFIASSENIDIREATLVDTIKRNIYLTNLRSGASIRMNNIFFEFAKANLLPSSKNELNRIIDLMNSQPTMIIELQGHTDSIGNDQSNMVLSTQRATAVRNYLIEQHISPKRLSVKAFGRTRPVATNKTDEGRQLNRRVELKVLQY